MECDYFYIFHLKLSDRTNFEFNGSGFLFYNDINSRKGEVNSASSLTSAQDNPIIRNHLQIILSRRVHTNPSGIKIARHQI